MTNEELEDIDWMSTTRSYHIAKALFLSGLTDIDYRTMRIKRPRNIFSEIGMVIEIGENKVYLDVYLQYIKTV